MNANTLKTKFQLRRDLEENWRTANPQLADGEPILVDVNGVYKLKIGDGNTYFNDLPYCGGGDAIVGEATSATLLRYNSLTNWNASDVILDEGEIVMAYDDSSGTTNYLMKIGDGTHTFSDLPAFHPYDIQVLDHIPTAAETNNNMITFVV